MKEKILFRNGKNLCLFFLDFVDQQKEIKTLTKEKWKKSDNSTIFSSHPPLENIIINHLSTPILATPFKTPSDSTQVKQVIEQNNYSNQSLVILGNQLDKIETKIDLNQLKSFSPKTPGLQVLSLVHIGAHVLSNL